MKSKLIITEEKFQGETFLAVEMWLVCQLQKDSNVDYGYSYMFSN